MATAGPTERATLRPGEDVGPFRVRRLLGRGGMGAVYLARDTALGREVALKVIAPERLGRDGAARAFLDEARATAAFNHPHIVTVYAVGEHAGQPWLALEYVEGQALAERLRDGPLPAPTALRVARAVAEALAEAHRRGIAHRDLKPANILIGADGRPRVLDFGVAARLAPLGSAPREPARPVGTAAYMAPEQLLGEVGAEADVWAFGLVLAEMLLGVHPLAHLPSTERVVEVTGPQPIRLPARPERLPEAAWRLLERCLAKEAARRPTAEALARELAALLIPGAAGAARPREDGPFRGLLPFTEADATAFFGREAEVAELCERLRHHPVMAVVGPSGAGKTSLLRAGVVPRLREERPWAVLRVLPGRDPFLALATALVAPGGGAATAATDDEADTDEHLAAERLAEELEDTPSRLNVRLNELAARQRASVLLLVDQLEELHTLVEDDRTRRRFLEAVGRGANRSDTAVRVVFAVRDDFLGRLPDTPAVRDALHHVMVLRPPEPATLRATLTEPLRASGWAFEDDALADALVDEVAGEVSCLPLLQFAARRLWELRDRERRVIGRDAVHRLGGVAGALAEHADGVLDGLPPRQVEAARAILLRLVTPVGTRRVAPRDEVVGDLGSDAEAVADRLIAGRLLTARRGGDLELVHEALIGAWARLARWLDQSREARAALDELRQAANLWRNRGREEALTWSGPSLADGQSAARSLPSVPPEVAEFLAAGALRERRQRRRRRVTRIGAMVALAAIAVTAVGVAAALADTEARTRRSLERARTEQAAALAEGARAAVERGEPLEARAKLRASLEITDSRLARATWWRVARRGQLWARRLPFFAYAAEVSPDGGTVALVGADARIHLLDAETLAERTLASDGDQVLKAAWSHDGRTLAAGEWSGRISLWDVARGQVSWTTTLPERLHPVAFAFAPDDARLAVSDSGGFVRVWTAPERSAPRVLDTGSGGPVWLAFSADGRRIAAGGNAARLAVWDLDAPGAPPRSVDTEGVIEQLTVDPGGGLVATGARDGLIELWRLDTLAPAGRLRGHAAVVEELAFAPDGRLWSASADGTVRAWDVAARREVSRVDRRVASLSFEPGGASVVTVAGAGQSLVARWRTDAFFGAARVPPPAQALVGLAFAPSGREVVTAGLDGRALVWDVASGRVAGALSHGSAVDAVAFSRDGRLLATGGAVARVEVWEADGGRRSHELKTRAGKIMGLAFDRRGRIWAATESPSVWIADAAPGGSGPWELEGHTDGIWDVAMSSGGARVATAGEDGTVRLWDADALVGLGVVGRHAGPVRGVAFSPDGARIASAGEDGAIRLWPAAPGDPVGRVLVRPPARPYWLTFSRDGARVAAPLADRTTRVYDVATGAELLVLRGHRAEAAAARFSPDGAVLATTSDDGTLRLWDAATGAPLRAPGPTSAPDPATLGRATTGLRDLPAGLPTVAVDGPSGIRVVGFDDGALGIWDVASGRRLHLERLHGALAELRWERATLDAATELGDRWRVDLGPLEAPHCDVLRDIWRDVAVTWEGGVPVRRAPPSHRCRPR